ncbi:MAG: chemotaxis protein CheD [Fimbriimonadaceae bacterium]
MTAIQSLVGIGEIQAVQGDATFICIGLGSCIGLFVSDAQTGVNAMAHFMLPKAFDKSASDRPAKFADTGFIALIEMVERLGGDRTRLKAVLAGGAHVLQSRIVNSQLEFGVRNTRMVKEMLEEYGIEVLAEETGGTKGRTLTVDTAVGKATIRSAGEPERILYRFK